MNDDSFPPIMSQEEIDDLKRPGDWPSGWWVFPAALISFIGIIAMVVS